MAGASEQRSFKMKALTAISRRGSWSNYDCKLLAKMIYARLAQ